MPPRFILALLGALVISGGCTLLLGHKISQRERHKEPMVRYAVAAKAMDAGEIIKPEEVTLIEWPASKPVQGALAKTEDAVGRSVIYPMEKGQIVLGKYLSAPGTAIGLTPRIAEGMRAVALKSDDVVGVAGFLFPGCRVDVLVTYHPSQGPEPVTLTVVQDAQVLAVGHQIQPSPDGKAASVNVVTVLVNPADAEKLVLASTQGSIYFMLRNGGDHQQASNTPVQLSDIDDARGAKPKSVHRPSTQIAKSKTYVVETIAGDKQTTVGFN
ncbi:Flp pilus assembly protein CpaB [Edaphobacter sp. HDX4]|uniref:Flp pilus assembly protein CpaB n=1 Tax=Edaphobacter sp. HDX4 TaxID=2794064 RepID=UPI002FE59A7B